MSHLVYLRFSTHEQDVRYDQGLAPMHRGAPFSCRPLAQPQPVTSIEPIDELLANLHDSTTRGSCDRHSVPESVRSPGYACVTRSTVPYGPRSDVSLGAAPGHSMRVVRSPDSSVQDTSQTGGAERLYNFFSAHPCNVVLSRLSSETNCSKRVLSSPN